MGAAPLGMLQKQANWHGSTEYHKTEHQFSPGDRFCSVGQRAPTGHCRNAHICHGYSLNTDKLATSVRVDVDKVAGNTRRLYAATTIRCPVQYVWQALTDYDGLSKFIPGLAENRCLERHPHGARLLQIGEQQIALGAKFRAKVVLDIKEYPEGVPQELCSSLNGNSSGLFSSSLIAAYPQPRSLERDGPPQDVAFSMVEGDFTAFKGIWRMQACSEDVTRLTYALHVQPQRWLPVRLIQSRIEGEIAVNLNAVRVYTEQLSRL